jgi:hypothetical protein
VAGLNQDYGYAGKSNNAEVELSRLIYRNQHRKAKVAVKGAPWAWRVKAIQRISEFLTNVDDWI